MRSDQGPRRTLCTTLSLPSGPSLSSLAFWMKNIGVVRCGRSPGGGAGRTPSSQRPSIAQITLRPHPSASGHNAAQRRTAEPRSIPDAASRGCPPAAQARRVRCRGASRSPMAEPNGGARSGGAQCAHSDAQRRTVRGRGSAATLAARGHSADFHYFRRFLYGNIDMHF